MKVWSGFHGRRRCLQKVIHGCLVVCITAISVLGCGKPGSDQKKSEQKSESQAQSKTQDVISESQQHLPGGDGGFEADRILSFDTDAKPYDTETGELPIQRVYRRDDDRPKHSDADLSSWGIKKYESKRLIIYTDSDAADIKNIPPTIDKAYEAWVKYFGPPLPSRNGSEFQMTGYIIRDRLLFKKLGMLPEKLDAFIHGKHDGYRFWIMDQETDYYRRHLSIHEATHCFMTIGRNQQPVWYLEGMAEYFGVHRVDPNGTFHFGVMPAFDGEFDGFGRIETIREEVAKGRLLSVGDVMGLAGTQYAKTKEPYAWSWALCLFLEKHPRYQKAFRKLKNQIEATDFRQTFDRQFIPLKPGIVEEWELFLRDLTYGYDFPRAMIDYESESRSHEVDHATTKVTIDASRGWQSTGILVDPAFEYSVRAMGDCVVSTKPKDLVSTADGISVKYFGGVPVGRLQGVVCQRGSEQKENAKRVSATINIGSSGAIRFEKPGLLLLRINDNPSERSDNSGVLSVVIVATTATN